MTLNWSSSSLRFIATSSIQLSLLLSLGILKLSSAQSCKYGELQLCRLSSVQLSSAHRCKFSKLSSAFSEVLSAQLAKVGLSLLI